MALRMDQLMLAIGRDKRGWRDLLEEFCEANPSKEIRGVATGFAVIACMERGNAVSREGDSGLANAFLTVYGDTPPGKYRARFLPVLIGVLARLEKREEACLRMVELYRLASGLSAAEAGPTRQIMATLVDRFPWLK